jgi:WD40 repeat protein
VSYLEKNADFFFGRERERDIITAKLLGSRLTVLYGPTGVGKTSILRAGVEHHLRELAKLNKEQFGKPEFVVVVFSIWRDDPLIGLMRRIRHCVAKAVEDPRIEQLELDSSLTEAIPKWSKLIGGDLLIILDQFEDYFLYHENEAGKGTFFDEIQKVVNRPDLRTSFLISIREDALAKLDRFKTRIPNVFDNCQRIKHLTTDAARSAIRGPITVYNRRLKRGAEYSIEDELVEKVCEQVKTGTVIMGGTGKGAILDAITTEEIETPYLQLVMMRLWKQEKLNKSRRLRLVTLTRLGGAEQIVETHLDNKMESLSPSHQRIASRIFANLVTPTGNKIAHTAEDLTYFSGISKDLLIPVLEELSSQNARILRTVPSTVGSSAEPRYEIFHDILATPVLDWRIRYNQEQERLRLVEAAKLKQIQDKKLLEEETRARLRRRYRRGVLFAMITATLLTLSLAVYALMKRAAATRALEEAEHQERETRRLAGEAMNALAVINKLDRSVPFFLTIMRGHNGKVNSVDFSPDARFTVTASADNTARIWYVDSGELVSILKGHTASVNKALFSPDGSLIATVSDDGNAKLWNTSDSRELKTLTGHRSPIKDVAFSGNNQYLATASDDDTARIWDLKTGKCISVLREHSGPVTTVAFSPSSQSVVTSSADKTARIWRTSDGRQLNILRGHLGEVNSAVFSPNNKYVVTASNDGTAKLWDAGNGTLIKETTGHTDKVNIAAFSPDGKLIVTASDDQTAKVWEVPTLRLIADFKGHTDKVVTAIFSPDGQHVITASADRTARLWDVSGPKSASAFDPKKVLGFRGHIGMLTAIAVTPKRSIAATSSEDNTARIWNTAAGGKIDIGELSLNAVPDRYSGPCPVVVTFNGRITVTSGAGAVVYRFVRSTGKPGPEKALSFDSPGTKEVSTVWKFGGPNYPKLTGAFYLEVVSRPQKSSGWAHFQITCDLPADSSTPTVVEKLGPPNGFVYGSHPSTLELTWKAVPGATEYTIVIQQYSPKNKTWQPAYILPANGTSAALSVKSNWTKMRWRVSAGNDDTKAAWWHFSFKE